MANQQGSPFKWIGEAFNLAGDAYSAIQAGKAQKRAQEKENDARDTLKDQMGVYSDLDTSNPFENLTNQFAGMENTMEDLTINQQQAEFQAQQFQQSQANIMSGLRGAAGASGIAAVAQSMAQQGRLASQQASASIGAQEAKNQALQARMAGDLQLRERTGAQQVQEQIARGQQWAQQAEMRKEGTLLGLASQDYRHYQGQTESAQARKDQAWGNVIGGVGDLAGSILGI